MKSHQIIAMLNSRRVGCLFRARSWLNTRYQKPEASQQPCVSLGSVCNPWGVFNPWRIPNSWIFHGSKDKMDDEQGYSGTIRQEPIKNCSAYPGVLKCYRWEYLGIMNEGTLKFLNGLVLKGFIW